MKKVAVIITHYGKKQATEECLNSLSVQDYDRDKWKLIIIDNGTGERFEEVEKATIIRNLRNLGYAKAVNLGIKEGLQDKSIKYFLILNNDLVLPRNFLTKILENPADITGPVIKFRGKDKRYVYDFGGKINFWTGRTTHIEKGTRDIQGLDNSDYVSGCCMLIKRKVIEEIGFFDPDYFFYYEDVDFCLRAKKDGYNVSVNPETVIYHKLSHSIGRWSDKAVYYNLSGNLKFISKHLGWKQPIGYFYLLVLTVKIIWDRINNR